MVIYMIYIKFIMLPLIGALIGWWTNIFAIKLIFRPYKPIKIPILGIILQGLIPKRRYELAENIGQTLEQEILSSDEIVDKLLSEDSKEQLIFYFRRTITKKVHDKLPDILPKTIKDSIINYLIDTIDKYIRDIIDDSKTLLTKKVKEDIDLKQMVEDKINSFDIRELEQLIVKLSKSELKQIEVLGGAIGFFIGLMQAILYYLFL